MITRDGSLQITKLPLPIHPPIMVFTARFLNIPSDQRAEYVVEFLYVLQEIPMYSGRVSSVGSEKRTVLTSIGSAAIGKNRNAILKRRMEPGRYTIVARVLIDQCEVWSNEVSIQIY